MKKLVLFCVLAGVMIMIPSLVFRKGEFQSPEEKLKQNRQAQMKVGNKKLDIEVVSSAEEMRQGLSGRTGIGSDGMLFVFPVEQIPVFWMKDMLFDIDIIWIRDDRVVEITKNVPKPKDYNAQLTTYSPKQNVNYVLEVHAGDSDRFGIEIGEYVSFE